MIAGILFKYKLDLACLSAYLAESANVNFGKFHLAYKLFTKENEKTLSGECSMHLVDNTAKKKKKCLWAGEEIKASVNMFMLFDIQWRRQSHHWLCSLGNGVGGVREEHS